MREKSKLKQDAVAEDTSSTSSTKSQKEMRVGANYSSDENTQEKYQYLIQKARYNP